MWETGAWPCEVCLRSSIRCSTSLGLHEFKRASGSSASCFVNGGTAILKVSHARYGSRGVATRVDIACHTSRSRSQSSRHGRSDPGLERMTQFMFKTLTVTTRHAPVVCAAPALFVEYISRALAVSFVAPASAVYAAPAPVVEYISLHSCSARRCVNFPSSRFLHSTSSHRGVHFHQRLL